MVSIPEYLESVKSLIDTAIKEYNRGQFDQCEEIMDLLITDAEKVQELLENRD